MGVSNETRPHGVLDTVSSGRITPVIDRSRSAHVAANLSCDWTRCAIRSQLARAPRLRLRREARQRIAVGSLGTFASCGGGLASAHLRDEKRQEQKPTGYQQDNEPKSDFSELEHDRRPEEVHVPYRALQPLC